MRLSKRHAGRCPPERRSRWPHPWPAAAAKDLLEGRCHRFIRVKKVCVTSCMRRAAVQPLADEFFRSDHADRDGPDPPRGSHVGDQLHGNSDASDRPVDLRPIVPAVALLVIGVVVSPPSSNFARGVLTAPSACGSRWRTRPPATDPHDSLRRHPHRRRAGADPRGHQDAREARLLPRAARSKRGRWWRSGCSSPSRAGARSSTGRPADGTLIRRWPKASTSRRCTGTLR